MTSTGMIFSDRQGFPLFVEEIPVDILCPIKANNSNGHHFIILLFMKLISHYIEDIFSYPFHDSLLGF